MKFNIEERMKQFAPNEDIEITGYTKMTEDCHFKCLQCGAEFDARPETIIKRHTKTICQNCHPPLRAREIKNREEIHALADNNPDIELLDIYVQRHIRVRFRCKLCNQINDFRWGDRKNLNCSCCSGSRQNCNQESYQYLLDEKYDHQFTIQKFTSMSNKVLLKCKCGFCFTILPCSTIRQRGIRCPKCESTRSRAELYIEKYLQKHEIEYEAEKHWEWMDSRTRYDFYLPSLNLIIEFHGSQHYYFTPYFHQTEEGFKKAQQRDKKKIDLALQHGLNYFIIPYQYQDSLKEVFDNLFGSTTISKESKAQQLEIQNFLNYKEEDIV